MPSSIPYDPSLVLGNIVDKKILEQVKQISDIQAQADAVEQQLNDQISLKRSLDMTLLELMEMDSYKPDDEDSGNSKKSGKKATDKGEQQSIETLKQKIEEVKATIYKTAVEYATIKTSVLEQVAQVKSGKGASGKGGKNAGGKDTGGKSNPEGMVHYSMESPIDYNRTSIKKMPISADSLKLNAQYFSYEKNGQSSRSMAATIKSYVTASVSSALGTEKASSKIAGEAARQAHHQYENHSIVGTLVVSVVCTHKDAALLAPLVIDVDKAIRSWNAMFEDDQFDTTNPQSMAEIVTGKSGKGGKGEESKSSIEIISGATYGSSFVAMVHILNVSESQVDESMNTVASQIQAQASGGWLFASVSGGFGLDSSYSNALKSLLSTQNIQSHCNIVTMGSIPSIKANDVKMAVKQFAKFDPEESMGKLAELQNAGADAMNGMNSSIDAARTGNDMVNLEASKVKSVLSGVSEIDSGHNKILDINSVMNALDDYINKALEGNLGVPINYYLESITKEQLAHMWIQKYYPFFFSKYLGQAQEGEDGGDSNTPAKTGE